jgi:5-hydroxyisourate hydrolase
MSLHNEAAGRLTTHVLDTASGKPAAKLRIDLFRVDGDRLMPLHSTRTNEDGRCNNPLLTGTDMRSGAYELRVHVGEYFGNEPANGQTPFLDVVPIRFCIDDENVHYHVPLLVAPFGYSTYRGS